MGTHTHTRESEMAKRIRKRAKSTTKSVQLVGGPSEPDQPKLTKREILKQCRALDGIIHFGSNVLYTSDELNRILSPAIAILEQVANER